MSWNHFENKGKLHVMHDLTLSVVIPTFNREAELCDTIKQLLNQKLKAKSIIIVDQSRDHEPATAEFLESQAGAGSIVLVKEKVANAARARNVGCACVESDIVLFLDDDVIIKDNFLDMHLNEYISGDCDAVSGIVFDTTGREMYGTTQTLKRTFTEMVRFPNLPGCNFSIRREAYLALEGFDPKFVYSSTHEDRDFSIRFQEAGFKAVVSTDASLIHLLAIGGGRSKENEGMIPRKQRLIPQIYFYLKNSSFPMNCMHIYSLLTIYVLTWYKVKHPVVFCRSMICFVRCFFEALKLKLYPDLDVEKYV